jgi:hypothetical protein
VKPAAKIPKTPTSDEARGANAGQVEEQENKHPDSDSGDARRKALATAAACLALKGFALHPLACGAFLICKWDRSVHCADLIAIEAFIAKIGGR